MLKFLKITQVLFGLLLLAGCSNEPALPDLATIPWIGEFGYETDELFPVLTSSRVPGPQVKVTVNNESHFLLIDVNTIDFIIRENTFRDVNFEPQRISNRITESSEMMFEEGYLHNVAFLNMEYPVLYVSMIKRSSNPFPAKGIIGRNFLIDGQITFDMPHNILAYTTKPAVALQELTADSNLVAINLHRGNDNPGLLKFYCEVNGTKYLASLSTRQKTTQISGELAHTLTGKTPGQTVTVNSLKIGAGEFSGLKCAVNNDMIIIEPENTEAISVIVGMDVISQCLLTIDFINGWMLVR